MRYIFLQRAGLKRRAISRNFWCRSFHEAKARFTTIDPKGLPVSYETEIRVGEPHEAFVYVEPEIGNAIKSSIIQQTGMDLTRDLERLPLEFNHKSYHFTYKTLPFPRVDIPQDLPRQTSGDISPATLWLSGNWHAITLDGTDDESFEQASRASARQLKGALEKLKDS
ncbi:hypothetical protein ACRALDRAFT_2043685 [Sodiomyces alcalophilus JCM 7366]|uniref:uncharacterized protein n=1 Tax=Sodiomyces alcalophilus JCM 7366 TaxID=591952 RepID=UPI0039B6AECD